MLGGLAFLVLVALMFLSAVPYGGGGAGIIGLMKLAVLAVPVWAAMPLVVTVLKKAKAARRATPRSRSGQSKGEGGDRAA
jgi:uncharacterized membrane protein